MRFRTALSLATGFVVCLTAASWATRTPERTVSTRWAPYPDNLSQSGKIASIRDAAFSLEVTRGQGPKTIEFLTGGDTKREGQVPIGSQATVEYRTADGTNLAVQVVVTPAAGRKAR